MSALINGGLRLADLSTFVAIVRLGSVSGAARSLGVTPSQVSKAVARLERQLNTQLLVRGTRGVSASAQGERLVPRAEDVLSRARAMRLLRDQLQPEITVVASAHLAELLLPAVAAADTGCRVRSLEMPPGVASAWASGQVFDIALTTGDEQWPASWVRTSVGSIRKALLTSRDTARKLGPGPIAPAQLAELPFIAPIHVHQGQVQLDDDGCPIRLEDRRIGHETQTLALALELAARTGQLVFAPVMAARRLLEEGRLCEVEVEGWDVVDPLYLVCSAERVLARVERQLLGALREALVSSEAPRHDLAKAARASGHKKSA